MFYWDQSCPFLAQHRLSFTFHVTWQARLHLHRNHHHTWVNVGCDLWLVTERKANVTVCLSAKYNMFRLSTYGATAYLQSWRLSMKKTWSLTSWLLLIHLLESLDSINLPKSMCADCSQCGPQITFRIFQIQDDTSITCHEVEKW